MMLKLQTPATSPRLSTLIHRLGKKGACSSRDREGDRHFLRGVEGWMGEVNYRVANQWRHPIR